ncbi:hypothetical protein TNCT_124451 [Trichonephila clavata]|uniref:Uncharacterized protein n=1 Tax=Trichonephila clavata TaxID=2740835 RepID=A0A8X6K719_TRICU|nr:hypothetical protein TNCT_124451 [Trichonephila clavata]
MERTHILNAGKEMIYKRSLSPCIASSYVCPSARVFQESVGDFFLIPGQKKKNHSLALRIASLEMLTPQPERVTLALIPETTQPVLISDMPPAIPELTTVELPAVSERTPVVFPAVP